MNLSPPQPDLAQCADEPIRVPGAIQPHGRMLVVEAEGGRLLAHSENWPGGEAMQQALDALLPRLAQLAAGDGPASVGRLELAGGAFDVAAHRNARMAFFEFEPAAADGGLQAPMYAVARHVLPQLQAAQTVQALCEL